MYSARSLAGMITGNNFSLCVAVLPFRFKTFKTTPLFQGQKLLRKVPKLRALKILNR